MDLFGLKARANAKLELLCKIDAMLGDGIISEAEYQELLSIAQKGNIKESELQTMIREAASSLLKKKMKQAIQDFVITHDEEEELWKFAQSAKITRTAFEEMIELNKQECLLPYIRQSILNTGKLTKEQHAEINAIGAKAKIQKDKIEKTIKEAINEYKKQRSKIIKERIQKISTYVMISAGSLLVIGLIIWGSCMLYRNAHIPKTPKELSIAPNPLFVLDDFLCGEISGTFAPQSMPKNGKLIITPFLEVEGARYYGAPVIYIGEDTSVSEDSPAIAIPYEDGLLFRQKFNIENPTYGKGMNLYLHFDAFYDGKRAKMKDKEIAPVWNAESLTAEKEYRTAGPALLAGIFGFLSFILLCIIVLFIWQGWFSSIFGFCTIPLMIIFFLLTYFPTKKVAKIAAEIDHITKQYDNAVRVHSRQLNESKQSVSYETEVKTTQKE